MNSRMTEFTSLTVKFKVVYVAERTWTSFLDEEYTTSKAECSPS